jgi:polysaccharide pyruvyl transferase WcaK-like protein
VNSSSSFLLVGNGPYLTRGCEAIVRGTMQALRKAFGENLAVRAGVMREPFLVAAQNLQESDPAISSFSISGAGPRGSVKWWKCQANKRLGSRFQPHLQDLRGEIDGRRAALEVGGDNYTLDYGLPEQFMAMDNFIQEKGLPVVLWGASVGPFDANPKFAKRIFGHLRTLKAVFVRESESLDYLYHNGVRDNVHLMADPAFLMEPEAPVGLDSSLIPQGDTIGINLSPLVGRYRGSEKPYDSDKWLNECALLVQSLDIFERPVLLVPHVGFPNTPECDFGFLQRIREMVTPKMKVPVGVLPDHLNAAELKWIISRCRVFAGARTHSTIAALSSAVPTLSIGYSLKARGINRDVYGHQDFCIPVAKLDQAVLVEKIEQLLDENDTLRAALQTKLPSIRSLALSAGVKLREMIG